MCWKYFLDQELKAGTMLNQKKLSHIYTIYLMRKSGMSTEDCAHVFGIQKTEVKLLLHTAKKLLKPSK